MEGHSIILIYATQILLSVLTKSSTSHPESFIRILHVDDEEEQLLFARVFLLEQDEDFEVISVSNTEEAIRLIETMGERFDCVISDFLMTGLDGIRLCLKIKKQQDIPYIIYTGRGSETVAAASFKAGVDDYVRKESDPSHYQLLARRIRSHVESYRRRREQERYQEKLETLQSNVYLISEADTVEKIADITMTVAHRLLGDFHGYFASVNNAVLEEIELSEQIKLDVNESTIFTNIVVSGTTRRIKRKGSQILAIPLKNEIVTGILGFERVDDFTKQDQRLLETLGLLVAQALSRIRQVDKIRTTEEQFRSIVENVQDVIMLTYPEGVISYISPSCEDIFGYESKQLTDAIWGDFIHPDDAGLLDHFYETSLRGEQSQINEYRVMAKTGEYRWVSHTWSPIMKGEKVEVIVSALNDITWRKKAEDELSSYAAYLEKVEDNLEQTIVELEEANKNLNDFAHVVSHDLKAPLMTIESFSSFLLEDYTDSMDETGKDYLHSVVGATERMTELIEGLLLLSRVGQKFTDYTTVDLNTVLNLVKMDLDAILNMKNAKLVTPILPTIVTQRVWVKQLFNNLVSNAVKFNESNPPIVKVEYKDEEENHLFKVIDNGIGIPEEHHDKVFNVFQRLHSDLGYAGTGAGLSICKKIVEALGGKIWFTSEVNEGSTFYFTLPKNREPVIKVTAKTEVFAGAEPIY